MKGQLKKLKRLARQQELLKNFEGDFYQEKKVGNEWLIKMFNGGTKKWQVAVFSETAYNKYKAFSKARKEEEELDNSFKEKIIDEKFERPTLESLGGSLNKIYKIKWRDSAIYDTQGENDYPFEVSIFESIGFVLRENKNDIVIARDILKKESRGVLIIPRENILQIKKYV